MNTINEETRKINDNITYTGGFAQLRKVSRSLLDEVLREASRSDSDFTVYRPFFVFVFSASVCLYD
jgi:hypothetical protein